MGQVYLTKHEAEAFSSMIHSALDSGCEEDELGSCDAISQSWIGLRVKAVKAGASYHLAHDFVKQAIGESAK